MFLSLISAIGKAYESPEFLTPPVDFFARYTLGRAAKDWLGPMVYPLDPGRKRGWKIFVSIKTS